jgi:hypothetical protein
MTCALAACLPACLPPGASLQEPPVTNMAHDMSAERRGPDMEVRQCHGAPLAVINT